VRFNDSDSNRFDLELHSTGCGIFPNWDAAGFLRADGWIQTSSDYPLDAVDFELGWSTYSSDDNIHTYSWNQGGQWYWDIEAGSNYYQPTTRGSLSHGQLIYFKVDLNLNSGSGTVQLDNNTRSFSLSGNFTGSYPHNPGSPSEPSVWLRMYTFVAPQGASATNTMLADAWQIETDAPWETPS
jgi:hypothetical protein